MIPSSGSTPPRPPFYLAFRSDRVGLWFTEQTDNVARDPLRFDADLTSGRCSRKGKEFDCAFAYADLRVASDP